MCDLAAWWWTVCGPLSGAEFRVVGADDLVRALSPGTVVTPPASQARIDAMLAEHTYVTTAARMVPAMKNDCAAARVVRIPAVAAGGVPYTPDCVVRCRPVSSSWYAF